MEIQSSETQRNVTIIELPWVSICITAIIYEKNNFELKYTQSVKFNCPWGKFDCPQGNMAKDVTISSSFLVFFFGFL